MADVNRGGQDDYLHVSEDGEFYMHWNGGKAPDNGLNAGTVRWLPTSVIVSGGGAKGHQVRFAGIINGDGKADYIHLAYNGAAALCINQGRRETGGWGRWNWA